MATLTVYADAGGDGFITSGAGTFANCRAGTAGLSANSSSAEGNVYIDTSVYLRRHYFPFDTSSIGASDTIDSAVLTLTCPGNNQVNSNGISLGIVESAQANLTSLSTSDWAVANYTRLSSDKTIASLISAGSDTAHDYTLNATGESIIAKGSGFTKLACLTSADIDNSATAGGNYSDWYFSDETTGGTTYDPKLVVTHSAGASSNIKTLNGVAKANISTWNGLAL